MSIQAILLKAVNLITYTHKQIGDLGEKITAEYLRRRGFTIVAMKVARKTGEIDVIGRINGILHFVEVKTMVCDEFDAAVQGQEKYDPSFNLHTYKIKKVVRTAEWYIADTKWEGEWQVDGAVVWLRRRDGIARITYFPQVV